MPRLLPPECRTRVGPSDMGSDVISNRKRLGQFFSGPAVGRLLAALADACTADSIIDPMAGSADLLQSCLDIGARPSVLAGIEIDPTAHDAARLRLPDADLILGDAFDINTIARLPQRHWDLVIGNPPFVRYQDTARDHGPMSNATTTREHLIKALSRLEVQDQPNRHPLLQAAETYSGQADLAVPACLLSMALVRKGGRLALVLPATFLTRDYAAPLRDCLSTLFVIEHVVEDAGTDWFPDALVKTMLIVARRAEGASTTTKLVLRPDAASGASLVAALYPNASQPELAFAQHANAGRIRGTQLESFNLSAPAMMEGQTTLQALGVEVGQGLRTGANDFFYVRPLAGGRVQTSRAFGEQIIRVPSSALRSAVRDQKAFKDSLENWAVLDLRGVALPEDLLKTGSTDTPYAPMPSELAAHVRRAATTLSGKPGRQTLIPNLSAVRPNARPARPGRPARFWYMLPDFQPRHLPDIILPRVVNGRPHAMLMTSRENLADANFVTLRAPAAVPATALISILNSAWFWCELERRGTVLGGGALKLESVVVKRVPFPELTPAQIGALSRLGARQGNRAGPWLEADRILFQDHDLIDQTARSALSRLLSRCPTATTPEIDHD